MFNRLIVFIHTFLPKLHCLIVYRISNCRYIKAKIPLRFQQVNTVNVGEIKTFRNQQVCDIFKSFLSDGERGIYGYLNESVIAHGWAIVNHTSTHQLVAGYFDLPPHAAFIHFCRVDEKYRGNKVYQELLSVLCENLVDYTIYIDTNIKNSPAQKAIQAVGAKYIYNLKILQCRNKYFCLNKFK